MRVTALVGAPTRTPAPTPAWSWCLARPALSDASPVDEACRGDAPSARQPLGTHDAVQLVVPTDACARFGPDPPADTQSAGRPADPDSTGGYVIPLHVRLPDTDGFGTVRLRCNLAGVAREVAVDYAQRARPNTNPRITAWVQRTGETETPVGDRLVVAPGQRVTFRVAWPVCEDAPCEGAERYLLLDPITRTLVTRRESMRASWYATDGRWDAPRTGRSPDETTPSTDNTWTAPSAPGSSRLWVALRDARGGTDWRELLVEAQP